MLAIGGIAGARPSRTELSGGREWSELVGSRLGSILNDFVLMKRSTGAYAPTPIPRLNSLLDENR